MWFLANLDGRHFDAVVGEVRLRAHTGRGDVSLMDVESWCTYKYMYIKNNKTVIRYDFPT